MRYHLRPRQSGVSFGQAAEHSEVPGIRVFFAAAAVFVVALAVRVAWVHWVSNPFDNIYSDMGGYIDRALRLTGQRPPGLERDLGIYPFGTHSIYAAEMEIIGWNNHPAFCLVHCVWGAAVAPLALLLALRIVPRLWLATIVGLLLAVWQPLVVYSSFFSSEQISSALFIANAWLLTRHLETGRSTVAAALTGAATYLVRPQFLLTVVLLTGAYWLARRHWVRRRVPAILAIVGVAVGVGVVRYTTLSGHLGLICDGGAIQRLFADTDIGVLRSSDDSGRHWLFSPPSKVQTGEMRTYSFHGFIGDRDAVEKARRDEVRRLPLSWRVRHWMGNVALLVSRNLLWPESNHVKDEPWRLTYNTVFARAVLWMLPLAALGFLSTALRPRVVPVIAAAHLLTIIITAAVFYGEARYRVPYDPFLILLALEGCVWTLARARALVQRRRGAGFASLEASGLALGPERARIRDR